MQRDGEDLFFFGTLWPYKYALGPTGWLTKGNKYQADLLQASAIGASILTWKMFHHLGLLDSQSHGKVEGTTSAGFVS